VTSSCQYHNVRVLVIESRLQPTPKFCACSVTQNTMHKLSCVLLWKEVLHYTFLEDVTCTVLCWTTLPTAALLAASARTPTCPVRELCSIISKFTLYVKRYRQSQSVKCNSTESSLQLQNILAYCNEYFSHYTTL
jgi:hypothetical protein